MRATLFFKTMRHGRKIYSAERNTFMADLCNVATIPLSLENHKTFSKMYLERVYGAARRKALDLKDEKTAHILAGAFWASSPIRRH